MLNKFSLSGILKKIVSQIRFKSVKVLINLYLHAYCKFWNRKIYNHHGTYAFYELISFLPSWVVIKYSWSVGICIYTEIKRWNEWSNQSISTMNQIKVVDNEKIARSLLYVYILRHKSWICEIYIKHFAEAGRISSKGLGHDLSSFFFHF